MCLWLKTSETARPTFVNDFELCFSDGTFACEYNFKPSISTLALIQKNSLC